MTKKNDFAQDEPTRIDILTTNLEALQARMNMLGEQYTKVTKPQHKLQIAIWMDQVEEQMAKLRKAVA